MAEIKEFSKHRFLAKKDKDRDKDKEKKAEDKNQRSIDHMLARHRRIKIYTVLIAIAVLAVLTFVFYLNWKSKVYVDYEVVQQTEWTKSSDSRCLNLAGTLFTYSNEMQNPIVRTCKKTVAVGDYNGRSIYISDTQGILGMIETTMPIRDFCVSSNGIVAAVLDDSTVTAIHLYSTKGEHAYFKTTMSQSGYPIAIDISDDGTQVAVSYIKADNGQLSSSIGFYNFSAVGQNYTDNLVSGYGYADAVVPMVHYMENDTVFAVADNRLMFFKGRQKPESILDTLISEEIRSVFYDKNHVGIVFFNPTGETTYRLEIYDTSAKKTNEINFSMEYTDILFDTASIIIRNDNECLLYDWDNRVKFQGTFMERILCLLPMGNIARYTLVTEHAIQTIELQ